MGLVFFTIVHEANNVKVTEADPAAEIHVWGVGVGAVHLRFLPVVAGNE